MNREQFVSEVNGSGIGPENFNQIINEFSEYQNKAMKILRAIHNVCEKEKINYQLAYGSLLGAIRDGGQIPWDYDIDIFVLGEERDRLISALKNGLSDEYYIDSLEINKSCGHVISRVTLKGFDSRFLHVDIFYVMGTMKNDDEDLKRMVKECALLYKAKAFNFMDKGTASKRELLVMFEYKIKGLFKKKRTIWKKYKEVVMKHTINDCENVCSADRFSDWYDFSPSFFQNTKLIRTENGEFRIPVEYEKMLKIIYGDYKKIPPLEDRLKELMRHYRFLQSDSRK